MLDLLTKVPQARLFFSPSDLPSNGTGQKPLTIAQFLVIDKENKKIDVMNVLGAPAVLPPGDYALDISVRPKKNGTGQSYWYKFHTQAAK